MSKTCGSRKCKKVSLRSGGLTYFGNARPAGTWRFLGPIIVSRKLFISRWSFSKKTSTKSHGKIIDILNIRKGLQAMITNAMPYHQKKKKTKNSMLQEGISVRTKPSYQHASRRKKKIKETQCKKRAGVARHVIGSSHSSLRQPRRRPDRHFPRFWCRLKNRK